VIFNVSISTMWPNKGAAPQQPLRSPVSDGCWLLVDFGAFSQPFFFDAAVGELGTLGDQPKL
jgi:hypothetical protein